MFEDLNRNVFTETRDAGRGQVRIEYNEYDLGHVKFEMFLKHLVEMSSMWLHKSVLTPILNLK